MLKTGEKVQRKGEWNTYLVIKACDKYATLKCISFVREEDLGDRIYCTIQDQETIIAQWHASGFEPSPF